MRRGLIHINSLRRSLYSLLTCLFCLFLVSTGCEPGSHKRLNIDAKILLEPAQQQKLRDYLRALEAESVNLSFHEHIETFILHIENCPRLYNQPDSLRNTHLHKLSRVIFDCTSGYDEVEILTILWAENLNLEEINFFRGIDMQDPASLHEFEQEF